MNNNRQPPSTHMEQEGNSFTKKRKTNNKTTRTLNHDLNATIAPIIDPEAPHEVLK